MIAVENTTPFRVANESSNSRNSKNEIGGDIEQQRAWLREEGYLFLKDIIDRKLVESTRRDILAILDDYGVVDRDYPIEQGHWNSATEALTGGTVYAEFYPKVRSLPSIAKVAHYPAVVNLMADLLCGELLVHTRYITRFKYAGDAYDVVGPHQDFWYIKGTEETYTIWAPYMDLDASIGGLAVAPGTHRRGPVDHTKPEDSAYSGIQEPATPMGWRWSPMKQGDILIFHSLNLHCGLLNTSPYIRLSADNRYQLKSLPIEPSSMLPHRA